MNIVQILGIAAVIATLLEVVTRGRIGPWGILVAIVIAVIIASQGWDKKRPTASSGGHASASDRHTSSDAARVSGPADPYILLGVQPGCSDDELSRAYHRRVREWHPDQLEGMAEELRQHANARLAEINRAFDAIQASRKSSRT